ncbi:hypothetical protein SLA2020_081930 [Shorea laevis]
MNHKARMEKTQPGSHQRTGSSNQPVQRIRTNKPNGKMAEAFNADINFKSNTPMDSFKAIKNISLSKSGFDLTVSTGPQTKPDKGKKVVYKIKETSPKDNKGNSPFGNPSTSDGIISTGLSNQTMSPSLSLENSLLSVKDRIKNLEKSSKDITTIPPLVCTNKDSGEKSTQSAKVIDPHNGDMPNPLAQPHSANASCDGQQNDFNGGSTGAPIVEGGLHAPILEQRGDFPCVAQASLDTQINRPNAISQLNTSSDSRFDSFNRSIQPSKARIPQRRSKHRRDKRPYPTFENPDPGMVPTSASHENVGPDGGSQMSSPSLPLFEGEYDATAQGNSGAIIRPDVGQDDLGSQ